MSVRVEQGSGGSIVVLSGDADLTIADELAEALQRACGDGGDVLVDLSGATLLDSRVIGILLACAERLRPDGGAVTLAGANANVRRLFTTIGLDREFRFVGAHEQGLGGD